MSKPQYVKFKREGGERDRRRHKVNTGDDLSNSCLFFFFFRNRTPPRHKYLHLHSQTRDLIYVSHKVYKREMTERDVESVCVWISLLRTYRFEFKFIFVRIWNSKFEIIQILYRILYRDEWVNSIQWFFFVYVCVLAMRYVVVCCCCFIERERERERLIDDDDDKIVDTYIHIYRGR